MKTAALAAEIDSLRRRRIENGTAWKCHVRDEFRRRVGYLIGDANSGLQAMFHISMNRDARGIARPLPHRGFLSERARIR